MWKWIRDLFRADDAQMISKTSVEEVALKRLWWLLDAPLFIDDKLVKGFYDAVVRPEFELQGKTIGEINEKTTTLLIGGSGGAELGLPSFLSVLGPKVKATGKVERTRERRNQASEQFDWKSVKTAGRRLLG